MDNTLDQPHASFKFTARPFAPCRSAAPEPLRVAAQPFQAGECPFLGGVTRAIGSLRPWLAELRDNRRAARFDVGSIDDRTLDDIGLTRADMLYPGSKTSRKSRLGLREDLRADL